MSVTVVLGDGSNWTQPNWVDYDVDEKGDLNLLNGLRTAHPIVSRDVAVVAAGQWKAVHADGLDSSG
jgi:hypothetical protein